MCSIITTVIVVFVLFFGLHCVYLSAVSNAIINKTVDRDFKECPEYNFYKKLETTMNGSWYKIDFINNQIIFYKLDTYNYICPELIKPSDFKQVDPYSYFIPFKIKVCL